MTSPIKLLLVVIIAVLHSSSSTGDVFTSLEKMKGLARLESFLPTILEKYLDRQQVIPRVLLDFLDLLKTQTRVKNDMGLDRFVLHPTNAFKMIRRFLKHWTELANYLNKGPDNDLKEMLNVNRPIFPKPSDLLACAEAILRIQDVYNLTAKQIAKGHISMATEPGLPLDADECYELGYTNHKWKYFEQARDWMWEALLRMGPGYEGLLTRYQVLEYLSWAEYQVGDLENAIKHTKMMLKEEPESTKAYRSLDAMQEEIIYQKKFGKDNLPSRVNVGNRDKGKEDHAFDYERLCRGQPNKIVGSPKQLRCYYKSSHPLLRLKPAKIEVLDPDRQILLLRDVINESQMQFIKELAAPKLQRAKMETISAEELEYGDHKTSKSAWLGDADGAPIAALSRRIEAITDFHVTGDSAESLQVVHFGIGGHFEPRYGYNATSRSVDNGPRDWIATVLLYLNFVDAGGSNVFLDSELSVSPQKGSAVFWLNMRRSGKETLHAACPVIVGHKWVAKKWIRERDQVFTRRCGLHEDE
ncbi:prolyl 4-hydroxylase subunit alpha-1 [Nematostella vectensis]|uniref:prolyl 4-hydroxylase subunit alpha-1 n=1 Tax=Nematostella vectensis TaxID=45351 RepID=UPI0013902A8C|nr:prolyl 4-hydroxylase subunit alpha-1 [Nematostella vectensis]